MHVKELMTREVESCRPDTNLEDVVGLMKEHNCGSLPVVDGEDRRVVGVVTDRDICLAAFEAGKELKRIQVSQAMSRDPVTCSPGDDISAAEKLMSDARVRRLPVVEDGKLTGILTLAHVARSAEGKNGPSERDVAETLAAISAPTA